METSVEIVAQACSAGAGLLSVTPEAVPDRFQDVFLSMAQRKDVRVFSLAPCPALMKAQDLSPVTAQMDMDALFVFLIHKIDNSYWFDW